MSGLWLWVTPIAGYRLMHSDREPEVCLRELAPVRVNFGLVRQIAPGLHGPYTEFWFGGDKASDWMKVAGTPEDYYERMRAAGASVPDPPVSIS